MTAPEFLNQIADALDAVVDATVRTTLLALAASAVPHAIIPGEVLGVPAGETASGAFVNVGALVTALAQAANSDRLIDLPLELSLQPPFD